METIETFTLDSDDDRDVLLYLSRQPDRSAVIREAIRNYMRDEGVSLKDILAAIESLKDSQSPSEIEQPEEAVANLLGMLELAES